MTLINLIIILYELKFNPISVHTVAYRSCQATCQNNSSQQKSLDNSHCKEYNIPACRSWEIQASIYQGAVKTSNILEIC